MVPLNNSFLMYMVTIQFGKWEIGASCHFFIPVKVSFYRFILKVSLCIACSLGCKTAINHKIKKIKST